MILVEQDQQGANTTHSNSRFPRSGVLLLLSNAIHSLVPTTLTSQAEALLDSHRIEDAVDLADQQHRKVYGNITVDHDQAEELRYVYQRIGFQCFSETLFEDAGKNLFKGDLDPRLLIKYYPELRGSLFTTADSIDVFAGVADRMPTAGSVDEIIRNYSPHLAPNTKSAPPTAELRKILGMAAQEMLEAFLKKWRTRRQVEADQPGFKARWESSYSAVDTVLAKLLAQFEKTADLYSLVQEPNAIIIFEVEPVFKKTGQYNALCLLYKQTGNHEKLLDVWSKVIDGEWTDEDIEHPLEDMFNLLMEKKDRVLSQRWGLWLTKRDPERGLKLLTARQAGKGRPKSENDEALLAQIEETSPAAATQFLEHLVLQKRTSAGDLHTRYALACVHQLLEILQDEAVVKLWRAKTASYTSSRTELSVSFLSYFASTTPDSDSKRVRIKTALFLQASHLYDIKSVYDLLIPYKKVLIFEMAILDGKLGKHRDAISSLVHELHDSTSAEAYCTSGGGVVPPKLALSILEATPGLESHRTLWSNADTKGGAVDDELKRSLAKVLLEVYMSDRALGADRAARLLDSQSRNLDVADVVTIVPPDWSLTVMSTFLARSFRALLHERHQNHIMKSINAGQNLRVKEESWPILRDEGMVVEEAADDEEPTDDSENEKFDEKEVLRLQDEAHIHHIKHQEAWSQDETLDIR